MTAIAANPLAPLHGTDAAAVHKPHGKPGGFDQQLRSLMLAGPAQPAAPAATLAAALTAAANPPKR